MSEKRGMCGDSMVTCSNNGEAVQSDTRTENLQSLAATTLYINYNIYKTYLDSLHHPFIIFHSIFSSAEGNPVSVVVE